MKYISFIFLLMFSNSSKGQIDSSRSKGFFTELSIGAGYISTPKNIAVYVYNGPRFSSEATDHFSALYSSKISFGYNFKKKISKRNPKKITCLGIGASADIWNYAITRTYNTVSYSEMKWSNPITFTPQIKNNQFSVSRFAFSINAHTTRFFKKFTVTHKLGICWAPEYHTSAKDLTYTKTGGGYNEYNTIDDKIRQQEIVSLFVSGIFGYNHKSFMFFVEPEILITGEINLFLRTGARYYF